MKTTYNGITYNGFLELTINTHKVLRQSNDSTRVLAFVQNEDVLETYMLDPLNLSEAVTELVRFFMTEEPWASWQQMSFFVAAREHFCEITLENHIKALVNEGKLQPKG